MFHSYISHKLKANIQVLKLKLCLKTIKSGSSQAMDKNLKQILGCYSLCFFVCHLVLVTCSKLQDLPVIFEDLVVSQSCHLSKPSKTLCCSPLQQ